MNDEKTEASEKKGKAQRFTAEVTEVPSLRHRPDGSVSSFSVPAKVRFKGDVTLRAKGDVAAAYWSVTPGMRLTVVAEETGDKEYTAESIDLVRETASD